MGEEKWSVTVNATGTRVQDPGGEVAEISWEDTLGIFIETNDSGPLGMDVIWLVAGENGSIMFPMGAQGEGAALQYFQSLPGFNNKQVIQAMSCSENQTFEVWRKAP
ncbi:MAG: hypothetical protein JNM27_06250 [Leptospirales bacterium]|nr:hypothetical protein [Leptospirales bacterium]